MKSKSVVRVLLCALVVALCAPSLVAVANASAAPSSGLHMSTSTTQESNSQTQPAGTHREAVRSLDFGDFVGDFVIMAIGMFFVGVVIWYVRSVATLGSGH